MRNKLIGAAAVAMLFGGAALAQSTDIQQNPNDLPSAQPAPSVNQGCGQMGSSSGTGGTGQYETPPPSPESQQTPTYTPAPTYVAPPEAQAQEQERSKMRGLMVTAGAGAEGYAGPLARDVRTGFGWGVTAAIKPTKVFGLELGYSGATNNFNSRAFTSGIDTSSGTDMIRNGGHVAATFGLGAAPVQPYVLAGIGIDRYTVRPTDTFFRDSTSGNVPLGLGVRAHIGRFTADLRGAYNVLLSNSLTTAVGAHPVLGNNILDAGRWDGTLNLGGTF